nr:MAG TPA: hypothetical protein [Caudoviricetes sp.]
MLATYLFRYIGLYPLLLVCKINNNNYNLIFSMYYFTLLRLRFHI